MREKQNTINYIFMRHIIRIEDPRNGYGHFQGKFRKDLQDIFERHSTWNPNGMQTPFGDGIDIEREDFCAYTSIKKFRNWIKDDEVIILSELGFRVYLIKIPSFRLKESKSKQQVCFKKEDIYTQIDITDKLIQKYEASSNRSQA